MRSLSGWPLSGHLSPGSFVRRKSVNAARTSGISRPAFTECIFFFARSRSFENLPSKSRRAWRQSTLPSSTSSSSSSIRAVYSVWKNSSKPSFMRSTTRRPRGVGMKRRSFLWTYSRCSIFRRVSA